MGATINLKDILESACENFFLANIPRGRGESVFCVLGLLLIFVPFSRVGLVSRLVFDKLDEGITGISNMVFSEY